ncbi:hypothetical protein BGZ65_002174 [Modicella reniformis]|uniref:Uncharacterized protein n=1 Tax=Modicella reniformis TaxID=1440133 RepID=A0A9P6IRK9_9FUNG|nr:hypothetical protein BGZ65_002174 [Modicella reniformis]
MPVSVDDPFLLASFSTALHHHQRQAVVTCTPETKQEEEEEEEEDPSSLLLVVVQGEGVQLFNTTDQKCILSYSAPPGYSFAGSAQTLLRSARQRNVYAVIAKGIDIPTKEEERIVWMWKDDNDELMEEEEEDLVKSSTARKTVHKFDRKIHQLFVSSLLPNHVLLTNTDGSITLVVEDLKRVIHTHEIHTTTTTTPSALKSSKKGKKDKKIANIHDVDDKTTTATMIWATTYNTSESWIPSSALAQNLLIIMTIVESGAEKMVVTLSYVNEERRGFITFGQTEIDGALGGSSSGFAFDVKTGQLSFMTATGQLKIYRLEMTQGDHTVSATETLTLPLPGYALPTSVTTTTTATPKTTMKPAKVAKEFDPKVQHVDAVSLGDNYLAIAGIHHTEGKAEQTLTIWDIKYGTLQAKHVMPGSFTAQNTICQLTLLPESVLAMTVSALQGNIIQSDIYLCPFYAEPMSLLGAMGRMAETAPFLGQKGSMLIQDVYTITTTTSSDMKAKEGMDLERQISEAQVAERTALELLGSESKTCTVKEFEKVFFKHVKHQIAQTVNDINERYGVDTKEVKAKQKQDQQEEEEKKKARKQKRHRKGKKASDGAAQKMDVVDTESLTIKGGGIEGGGADSITDGDKSKDRKKKKKEKKEAAKVTPPKKVQKSKSKATTTKNEVEDPSSESSSSEDDDDGGGGGGGGEDEAIVLTSSEEDNREMKDDEEEEEQEYEVSEEGVMKTHTKEYKNAMEEWHKVEAEMSKNYRRHNLVIRAGWKQTPLPDLSHHFVTKIVSRCFSHLPNGQPDMSFWPVKVVEYLVENQLVGNSNPGAGQSGIALNLMERGEWALLELTLKKLHDIPEMDMIMMLKQVIGLNKNKDSTPNGTASSSSPSSSSSSVPDIPQFMTLIMAAPRNEVFMQQALKRLNVEELSVVLGILKGWIDIWDERGGIGHQNQGLNKKQLPGGLPGYGLMIDFITLLMDVHFPLLILSPHLHPILVAIHTSIQRETDISNKLEQALRGPLGLFDRKHRETERRRKEATVAGFMKIHGVGGASGGGINADKRRRRKWEGGEGIPDYGVEIIHL